MRTIFSSILLFFLCACSHGEEKLKVAASSVPQADILNEAKKELAKEGVELKVIEIDDYTTPNRLLAEKQVDANYFQHKPFLDLQEKQFGYKFRILTSVHIEPMGIYSKKIDALDQLKDGD